MKKVYLTLCFLLFTIYSFADQEEVCVVTNTGSSGQACTANSLGFVNPCSQLSFIVKYRIPEGFAIVAKYEWFVNSVSVKTTTTPSDWGLVWDIKSKTTTVYCKVTYKKQDGTLSQEYTSTSFTPNVKSVGIGSITTSTASPNYGCSTNQVRYRLNELPCTGSFCSGVYNVSQYSISWQPPSGWIQTSISANGNNVTFLPDATTGGTLTATITLPCGYADTRTYTINREMEKPTFSTSNNTICTSSASFAINPVCGASDYTYTIVGSAGITFGTNGQQALTTSSTTVNINFAGTGSTFALKVKSNFPNSLTSEETTIQSKFGVPDINNFNFLVSGPSCINYNNQSMSFGVGFNDYFGCQLNAYAAITEVEWQVISSKPYQVTYNAGAYTCQFTSQVNKAGLSVSFSYPTQPYVITFLFRVKNACGWSDWSPGNSQFIQACGGGWGFTASPNPTDGTIQIALNEETIRNDKTSELQEIQVMDKFGKTVKRFKYGSGNKKLTININELKSDIYFIKVFNGKEWKGQSVIRK